MGGGEGGSGMRGAEWVTERPTHKVGKKIDASGSHREVRWAGGGSAGGQGQKELQGFQLHGAWSIDCKGFRALGFAVAWSMHGLLTGRRPVCSRNSRAAWQKVPKRAASSLRP